MNKLQNSKLTPNSQKLRKEMTKEERHLWYDFLKQLDVTVHRQKVIDNYIVDFCVPEKNLIIELDGEHHYTDADIVRKDSLRDIRLKELGYIVLRFTNFDVNTNFRGVCETIFSRLYEVY